MTDTDKELVRNIRLMLVIFRMDPRNKDLIATAADRIEALSKCVSELEEENLEFYEDLLWIAFNSGIVRQDGKWITGGMSDAEWLIRELGASLKVPQDPDAIKNSITARISKRRAALGGE